MVRRVREKLARRCIPAYRDTSIALKAPAKKPRPHSGVNAAAANDQK